MSEGKTSAARAALPQVTMAEVARHATETDCWIVIRGKVYDVSGWAEQHPGGRAVYAFAGQDATDVFTTFHGPRGWKELASRAIAEVAEREAESPVLKDFRELRARFTRDGLFRSDKSFYALKIVGNFGILTIAIALLALARGHEPPFGSPWVLRAVSACFMGLFWQQSGWLAHDFCHHQVFANRTTNNAFAFLIGGVCQGFSTDWWKSKHNLHHASPNELNGTSKRAIDPDIDTLPLLAWSPEMLAGVNNPKHLALVRVQHFLFFPVLLLARFNWAADSVVHAVKLARRKREAWREVLALAMHYGWLFAVMLAFMTLPQALLYFALAQVVSGAMLAIVFVQSHNGMEVYSTPKDFVTAQMVSTRDIEPSLWNDWFTGGLNYQIEHHLFPTMPRHNLEKVREQVIALCAKHGLPYEQCGMTESTRRVLRCLAATAAHA